MKHKIKRRLSFLNLAKLAIAPSIASILLALMLVTLLSLAPSAYAADYNGNCADVPASVDGDVIISDSSCTIDHDVTATGNISVTAETVTTQGLNAGASMQIIASNGTIKVTGTLNSNQSGNGGNILITATGNVATDTISTNGGANSGAVEINANTSSSGSEFVIGGSGNTNGVNGSIITANTTAGGTISTFIHGGVFITNGNSSSTAGIKLISMNSIQVSATSSRSGIIQLNARNGKLKLPAGSLNADGQSATAAPTAHFVLISARRIEFGGNGLEIHTNGSGLPGFVATTILPKDGISLVSSGNYQSLLWTTTFTDNVLAMKDTLNFVGTGTAPLTVTANGNNVSATISGYPIKFSGGPVTIESKGAINHSVFVGYQGATSNTLGVDFAGTGPVSIDTKGIGGAGGQITLRGDKINLAAPSFTFNANGPDSGNGDSGSIDISSTNLNLKNTSTAAATANAALAGIGNAKTAGVPATVRIQPGLTGIKLGTKGQPDRWLVEAKGGSAGGNGGFVSIQPTDGSIQIRNQNAVDVSAIGPTGNGGKIELTSGKMLTFVGANTSLVANGGTTAGDGGSIFLNSTGNLGDFNVGTGADAVDLHANARGATGNGKGGTIDIAGFNNVTLTGAGLSVNAKGNGDGGTINIHDVATSLSVSGIIRAKGAGSGKGGNISLAANTNTTIDGIINASGGSGNGEGGVVTIKAGSLILPNTSNTHIVANGNGNGKGGALTMNIDGDISIANGNGTVSLEARNVDAANNNLNGNADGGLIDLTSGGALDLYGAAIGVSGGQKGGSMNLVAANQIAISGELYADGGPQGEGGSISLTADSIALPVDINTLISANGNGSGKGGSITLETRVQAITIGGGNRSFAIEAMSNGSGAGGFVFVNSAAKIDALGSAIKVSAGTAEVSAETGGLISLRNLSEDINLSGVFEARGGTNGNAGEIQVSAAKDIKLASGTQLLAKGYDAGNGGNIGLQAGALANVTSAMIFYASSDIQIDASSAAGSGKAGTVNITYADDSGGSVMNILGPVIADGATQGGAITFSNKSPILGLTVDTQVVSALKGTINFPASPLSFGFSHVTGIAPSGVPGPYFGNVSMSGTFLSLKALGSAELNLGAFEATDDIEIETDSGDVKSDEGTKLISTSGTIKFKSQTGKVGIGYLSPVIIKAPYVNVDFGSVPSAGTAIFLNSLRDVTVETFEASDGIFINSTNNIVFAENVRTTNGLIEVESGAQITLNSGKTISAAEGSISLRGTTKIELESNSSLLATTSTSDELLGNVFVSLLTINTGLTSPTPANVVINGNVTDTFFGFEGITADAPDNVLTAQNGRIIGLDTTILPSTQIHLGGNVTITAQGN